MATENQSLIIGLSVGVVGAVIIVVTVVVVYIFCCRKKCKMNCMEKGKPTSQKTKGSENYMYVPAEHDITQAHKERDDGMVDNVLYESMGRTGYTEVPKKTEGTVYADVRIESSNPDGLNGSYVRQETPSVVYSEVKLDSEGAYSEVRPNTDSAYSNVTVKPNSEYSDIRQTPPEATYSVVNKSSKQPPVPPKS